MFDHFPSLCTKGLMIFYRVVLKDESWVGMGNFLVTSPIKYANKIYKRYNSPIGTFAQFDQIIKRFWQFSDILSIIFFPESAFILSQILNTIKENNICPTSLDVRFVYFLQKTEMIRKHLLIGLYRVRDEATNFPGFKRYSKHPQVNWTNKLAYIK